MHKKSIVLLSYGGETEYRRAIFCIFSLNAWGGHHIKENNVMIYTDNAIYFTRYLSEFPVELIDLNKEDLESMMGEFSFIHRIKVSVISLTFKKFPGQDLLFLDSDMFFTKYPSFISKSFTPGNCYMHKREYSIKESVDIFTAYDQPHFPLAFIAYISSRDFSIGLTRQKFSENNYSWNSGVIGVAQDFSVYMSDVLRLTDDFYEHTKWFISEQLAFSFVLQSTSKINPTNEVVLHYCSAAEKKIMDQQLLLVFHDSNVAHLKRSKFMQGLIADAERKLKINLVYSEAILAFSKRNWYYGLKKNVQLLFMKPKLLVSLWLKLK